jgi:hypothetical protein
MHRGVMELTLRARMAKKFLPYRIEQRQLVPPDLRDWLPEGHLAHGVCAQIGKIGYGCGARGERPRSSRTGVDECSSLHESTEGRSDDRRCHLSVSAGTPSRDTTTERFAGVFPAWPSPCFG